MFNEHSNKANGIPSHILLVDDDYAVRSYFASILQRQHYRVSSAASAQGAMEIIGTDLPDVLILDQYLPDSTGEEMLQQLRGQPATKNLPIIFLTVDDSNSRFRSVMNLGADDYLTKPANPNDLVDAVAAQIRKHRLRRRAGRIGTEQATAPSGVPPEYKVAGTIGKGGTATAYRALRDGDEAECVVKVVQLAATLDPQMLARFSREGRVLERIQHPNVVRMYDHGLRDGYAYIAMEYIAGGTLKQMMGHAWTPTEAIGLLYKIAQGLEATHNAGVIHRDIKPENIMLRAQSLEPVLLDFGTAKDLFDEQNLTQPGTLFGTPNYIAPELVSGLPPSPATDVYACGAILYELLTGSKPFLATNLTMLLHQHLTFPVPFLPRQMAALQPLIEQLLAKDPLQRPRDGSAMVKLFGESLRSSFKAAE